MRVIFFPDSSSDPKQYRVHVISVGVQNLLNKSRDLIICSFMFFVILWSGPTAADQGFTMEFLTKEMADRTRRADLQVTGGQRAKASDWPATIIFQADGFGNCTATIVGERVILTAAHCVGDKQSGRIDINGKDVEIDCRRSPRYSSRITHRYKGWDDFALCRVAEPISKDARPDGIELKYESVNTDTKELRIDQTLKLVGFGCTYENSSERDFGSLYEGTASVELVPSNQRGVGPHRFTRTFGDAAGCYGDSGGGVYSENHDLRTRAIVGVAAQRPKSNKTLISTTSTHSFVQWAIKWAKGPENEPDYVYICGIHSDAEGCR